jgi:hypothetical protein
MEAAQDFAARPLGSGRNTNVRKEDNGFYVPRKRGE